MRVKTVLGILFLLLSTLVVLRSAPTDFSKDPMEFLDELEEFMKSSSHEEAKKEANKFIRSYKVMRSISEGQLDTIRSVCNMMRQQRMQAYPHFTELFKLINEFKGNRDATLDMDTWLGVLSQILASSKKSHLKEFRLMVDLANSLLEGDHFYQSKSRNFKSNSTNYKFLLIDGQLQLVIPKLDLMIYNETSDTIYVKETKGIYYPKEEVWEGEFGKIDWKRAGLDGNETYCEFGKYKINCAQSDIVIDTVTFHYNAFLKGRVLQGSFEDKLLSHRDPETTTYPRFESFENDIVLNEIIKNIHYTGGYTLHGSKTIGSGGLGKDAVIKIYTQSGKLAVKSTSKVFVIDEKKGISAKTAQTEIYIDQDSITHPGVNFKFDIASRTLLLRRGTSSIGKSGFYNSYHEMELYPEVITWNIDQPIMQFNMTSGAGLTDAVFQSSDYFDQKEFDKYQNILDFNPISVIKKYCDDYGVKAMFAEELAQRMNPNYSVVNIRGLLYKLVEDGFIEYDQEKELVRVKDKVEKYVLANRGLIDYDAIKIVSNSQEGNGTLNLETFEFDIKGVPTVRLSESKNLLIDPDSNSITVKKGMDMSFSGSVGDPYSGRLEFIGKGFDLNYDTFYMDMEQIDYIKIKIPDTTGVLNEYGKPLTVPLRSRIENASGNLTIDDANNKSSVKASPEYPIFKSLRESYVYYDDSSIHNAVYQRDKFYFKIKPFEFDSLETFEPENVKFDGLFVSQGIFPDFEEKLGIQREDMSLGFVTSPPTNGYNIYEGRGRFKGESLRLGNTGLRGNGTFSYLSSSSKSSNILFLPDSLIAHIEVFNLRKAKYKDAEVPHVSTDNVDIVWKPFDDKLDVEKKDGHFLFYNQEAKFTGKITLSPNGLTGIGSMDWGDGTLIVSKEFEFEANSFSADSSALNIKSKTSDEIAFKAENVAYHIDLITNKSTATKRDATDPSFFPYMAYMTTISDFVWDNDSNVIILEEKSKDYAVFTSTHPDQDSLQITGVRARYDLNNDILTIEDVLDLKVADCDILLDTADRDIQVTPVAQIDPFKNTRVVMNAENEYNILYNASVTIASKNKFSGEGYYDYTDHSGYVQQIFFNEIKTQEVLLDSTEKVDGNKAYYETIAKATIDENMDFTLNPDISFGGDVELHSRQKDLVFDGYVMMKDTNFQELNTNWLHVNNSIDPNDFYLNVGMPPRNKDDEDLFTGLFLNASTDSSFEYDAFGNLIPEYEIYFNYFNQKKDLLDQAIFEVADFFHYDPSTKLLFVGDSSRIHINKEQAFAPKGDLMQINYATGKINTSGKINIPLEINGITTNFAGDIKTEIGEDKYNIHVIAGIDVPILPAVKNLFIKDLQELTFDLASNDYTTEFFKNNIVQFLDEEKQIDKLFDDIEKKGSFDLTTGLDHSLLLGNLYLKHNKEYTAFFEENTVDIIYAGAEPINKKIKMSIELLKNDIEGNSLNILIKITDVDWYFFSIKKGYIYTLSSNATYNSILSGLKTKQLKVKAEKSKKEFIYAPASEFDKQVFLERLQSYKDQW